MPNRYSIVGTQFTGVPESFMMELRPGEAATLVREPLNPHDPNAVAVWIRGRRVGYVPKKQNAVLAKFIDETRPLASLALDSSEESVRSLDGMFIRSPNSGFPMVEV